MSILAWIVLGAVAGWIASALTGSRSGCLTEIVLGIVGAFIGGFVFTALHTGITGIEGVKHIALGPAGITGFNLWSLGVAVVGAVILILVVRALRRR